MVHIDIRSPNVMAHDNRLWLNWQWLQQRGVTIEVGQEVSLRDRDNIVCKWLVTEINERSNTVLCERRPIPLI